MRIIIVDGNNIGFAAQNGPSLTYDGRPVQAIFQALKMIKAIRAENRFDGVPMMLWDSRAEWRLSILPTYKGKRDEDPKIVAMKEEFKAQKPILIAMLQALGVHNITVDGYEADDLAGFFVGHYKRKGQQVMMVSGDKDWLQLVQPGVKWFDVIRVRSCTDKDFEEFTDTLNGRQWLEAKALMGDKSDNIDGIPGIGDKTAARLVRGYDSVENFLAKCKASGGMIPKEELPEGMSRAYKKLEAFASSAELQELFRRNIKLMNLIDAIPPSKEALESGIVRGNFNIARFREMCEELAFHSIIEEMDEWHELFYVEK